MSDVFEVSYVFHRNDVGRLQTVTVDIKRNHSMDILSIGNIYKIKSLLNKNRQFRYEAFVSFASM